jgi:membrane-associated phospholipid phosphatase
MLLTVRKTAFFQNINKFDLQNPISADQNGVKNTFLKTKALLLPYSVILICALCIKITYTKEDIYFFINNLHFAAGDIVFPYLTELGNITTVAVLCLLLTFVSYKSSLLLLTSQIVTSLVNFPLKDLFLAPRPKLYFDGSIRPIYYVPNVEVLSNHFSFPSGHTVCAFTSALVLTYISPRRRYGYLYLIGALLVAYSRMYMSQHFFEDVTAGSFVAVTVTFLWLSWFNKRKFLQQDWWNRSLSKKTP